MNYQAKGEHEKALEARKETFRLEPRSMPQANNLMVAYINLDLFEEAKAVWKQAFAEKLDSPPFHQLLLRIAYMQDDQAAQEKEIQWLAGKGQELQSTFSQVTNAYVRGQRRNVKELLQRVFEIQRRQGLTGTQPQPPSEVIDAQIGAALGDCEAARKGNIPSVLCSDASALRIALERAEKNPPPNPDTPALLYQRGLTALMAGKGAAAAAEFQRIVNHKGRNWGQFYSPAYLGLARSHAKAGDTAKARRAYQDFLALWKDADQDLPFYIQATRELAELR